MTMTVDLDQLAALARAATGGEWQVCPRGDPSDWSARQRALIAYGKGSTGALLGRWVEVQPSSDWDANADAAYIAAANPSVVLALIERVRALERGRRGQARCVAGHGARPVTGPQRPEGQSREPGSERRVGRIIVDDRPHCPMCGHLAHVQEGDEGQFFYQPDEREAEARVAAILFGAVDDERFESVMTALREPSDV